MLSQTLQGIRVLDFSQNLPGPYLTHVLHALGATVIKIEPPTGDPLRHLPPDGEVYRRLNNGKQIFCLDLKTQEGCDAAIALVRESHVVIESFRVGVLDRLGLGFSALKAVQSHVIMCSIRGFGNDPGRAGHDLGFMAASGMLHALGGEIPRVQIADQVGGGLFGVIAVLASLLNNLRNDPIARHIEIPMTDALRGLFAMELSGVPGILTGALPSYRLYRTQDARFVAVAALEPKFFTILCNALDVPELANSGLCMGDEGAYTVARLQEIFEAHPLAHWRDVLGGIDACCEAVLTPTEAWGCDRPPALPVREVDF